MRKNLLFLGCLAACSSPTGAPDSGHAEPDRGVRDASRDLAPDTPDVRMTADAANDVGAPSAYQLEPTLPSTAELGMRRGQRFVRGIIHAHSIHSHDACDGEPEVDGAPNEPCLADFRRAICETRQDYVFLTDHEELAALRPYDDLLLMRAGDEAVTVDGAAVANRMSCDNGHEALILPGGEFGTMPIGLPAHLAGTPEERHAAYEEVTPERVQALKDLGAVVLQAHAESKTRESLRSLGLDGFEVYQLHANLDPDIRGDYLGLEPSVFLDATIPFVQGRGGAADLVFLAFVEPNVPSIAHFDALVAEGQHLTGTAGTDCHQNALPIKMKDGERVDSYRRLMRWFTNYLLVPDVTPDSLKGAVRGGRLAIVFEAFGVPEGFDFRAESGGTAAELGGEVSLESAPRLVLERPTVLGYGEVETRLAILRIEADGAVVVAEGADSLELAPTEPGAYRATVWIRPAHLRDHLQNESVALADREYEWIWANPIYVR